MSVFKVGDRVKLAWRGTEATSLSAVGMEGVVIGVGPYPVGYVFDDLRRVARHADCRVLWAPGHTSTCRFWQLTPLLPPGQIHQPADMTISELLPFLKECDRV